MIVLGFFTRKVFVDEIGVEYLGLNGLLQNILGVMTLLEGGFSASVVYNMYKPLAEDDRPRILALLQLYKKVYRYIAAGVFLCGLLIYPFLSYFIADVSSLHYVGVVYFIFLFNSLIQYFTAYKWSIINASQQNYKLGAINLTYQVGLSMAKIAILLFTKNYILYLLVEALFGVSLNIAIVRKANALFPYIVNAPKYSVEPETKQKIVTNMKAIFLHSLGGYFMHSTDNIVMSAYLGVGIVGILSNYGLVTSTVKGLTSNILNSFSESVGNLMATESDDYAYGVFKIIFFVNFLTISIPVILMSVCMQPFIVWWLGENYILSIGTLAVILFNFYIDGLRTSAYIFKTKSGIFVQDRFTPLLQGILNLVLSLILVRVWGLTGVLLATGISILSIGFWQWPRLIYKHAFHKSLWPYFKKYLAYTAIFALTLICSQIVCIPIKCDILLLKVFLNFLVGVSFTAGIYFLSFRNNPEFISFLSRIKTIFRRETII